MIRSILIAATAAALLAGAANAKAVPCRGAWGKFIKCPPAAAAPAPKQVCKDAKGKFAKCGTPDAVPVKK